VIRYDRNVIETYVQDLGLNKPRVNKQWVNSCKEEVS